MLLSYIIPLYNCGDYIARCLESILNQGLDEAEYEVIVVNDGSTDDGASVVDTFCAEHPNIRLFSQSNSGVGAARNRGIDVARGEYITFVDADDYLLPGGMGMLKNRFLTGEDARPDLFFFISRTVDRHYEAGRYDRFKVPKLLYSGDSAGFVERHGFRWNVWGVLISRNYLYATKVRFGRHVICEDVLFMIELLDSGNGTVGFADLDIYRYVVRDESACTRYDARFMEQSIRSIGEVVAAIKRRKAASRLAAKAFEDRIAGARRNAFFRICSAPRSAARLKKTARKAGLFPLENARGATERFMNVVMTMPGLITLISFPYRYVFLPYIKPFWPRN